MAWFGIACGGPKPGMPGRPASWRSSLSPRSRRLRVRAAASVCARMSNVGRSVTSPLNPISMLKGRLESGFDLRCIYGNSPTEHAEDHGWGSDIANGLAASTLWMTTSLTAFGGPTAIPLNPLEPVEILLDNMFVHIFNTTSNAVAA